MSKDLSGTGYNPCPLIFTNCEQSENTVIVGALELKGMSVSTIEKTMGEYCTEYGWRQVWVIRNFGIILRESPYRRLFYSKEGAIDWIKRNFMGVRNI